MSETREKARALLADVATDGVDIPRALDVLAALCDENDAAEHRAVEAEACAAAMREALVEIGREWTIDEDGCAFCGDGLDGNHDGCPGMIASKALANPAGSAPLDRLTSAEAERDALRAELAQEAALRAELTAEVKRLKDIGADLLAVAHGCTDYGGGYQGACYEAFQHGIWTVVNVLKKRLAGDDDYQMRVLKAVGSGAAIVDGGE